MADIEPIQLRAFMRRQDPRPVTNHSTPQSAPAIVAFTRAELSAILAVYGRLMTEGECRDYAMDFGGETAVFSIFRRTSEVPLYRIEKTPKLARKQGAFCVVTPTGLILKRGHDLARVLEVLDKKVRVLGR